MFLDELVPAAPDVPIQIAHLAGSGPYALDPPVDAALEVFVEAIQKGDPRARRLWFDVTGVASGEQMAEQRALVASRIRQLGPQRVLYGSDAATENNVPREGWAAFRRLPLSEEEFRTIANNAASYLR